MWTFRFFSNIFIYVCVCGAFVSLFFFDNEIRKKRSVVILCLIVVFFYVFKFCVFLFFFFNLHFWQSMATRWFWQICIYIRYKNFKRIPMVCNNYFFLDFHFHSYQKRKSIPFAHEIILIINDFVEWVNLKYIWYCIYV